MRYSKHKNLDTALYCHMSEMPDYRSFCASLQSSAPPAGISDELQALWWARKDDWDQAHQIVQDLESASASHVHAYLHRVEGDLSKTRGTGIDEPACRSVKMTLSSEWDALVKAPVVAQASADSALR